MTFTLHGSAPFVHARRLPHETEAVGARAALTPRRPPVALLDGAAITVGSLLAHFTAHRSDAAASPLGWTVLFGLLTMLVLRRRGLYRFRVRSSWLDEPGAVAVCSVIAAAAVIVLRSIVTPDLGIAGETIRLWLAVATFLVLLRAALGLWERKISGHGHAQNALIVGAGTVGVQMARRMLERPELGLRPVGFLDKEPTVCVPIDDVPVLGASWDLERQVREHDVTQVVFAFSTAPHHVYLDLLRQCHELGVGVLVVPRLFEKIGGSVEVEHVGGMALLKVTPVAHKGWEFEVKHVLDRVGAALALLILSPVMILIALAVKMTSAGPILYRQLRVSRDGSEFEMLKFRTMYQAPDSDGDGRAAWAAAILGPETPLAEALADRRTPLGRVLRRVSLDELPQFINVLRGDMSLVGPRPETPLLAERFESRVYRYADRHRVKCGITGWAQVQGLRGDTSLTDRVEWDNYYIENWSPWLDLKILLMTVPAAMRGRHAA